MSFGNSPSSAQGGSSLSLLEHMFSMPRFHKSLLTLSVLLFGSGLTGQAMNYFSQQQSPTAMTSTTMAAPLDNSNAAVQPVSSTTDQPADQPLFARLSPHMTRVGLGFIAGFVLGWAFRAFLKLTAMLTSLGVAIPVGLSYFHVLNIDFTSVEKKYQSDMAWVSDQAERLAKSLLSHIPGSASSFAGMFVGFRRK